VPFCFKRSQNVLARQESPEGQAAVVREFISDSAEVFAWHFWSAFPSWGEPRKMLLSGRHFGDSPDCCSRPGWIAVLPGFFFALTYDLIYHTKSTGEGNLICMILSRGKEMAKSQHGGKREGAGRKTAHPEEGPTVNISASVPSGLVDRLDALAKKRGWNRSAAITEAIRGLLGRK
jgi:hypothetical protein